MKTLLHTFAALTLATVLAACGGSHDTESKSVDAEDYTQGASTVTSKRVDPQKTKKVEDGCKVRYTTGSKKGQCKTKNYKTKVVDDTDYVLVLANGYEVDVDQEVYDSYDLTDADKAADVFPRA